MSRRRWLLLFAVILPAALGLVILVAPRYPATRALYNISEYRLRRWWWDRFGPPQTDRAASLQGWVTDHQDHPIPGALVLVSTATGQTATTYTDDRGGYLLADIPAGSYRPIAAAWGYALPAGSYPPQAGPVLRLGVEPGRWDAVLSPYQPPQIQPELGGLVVGDPVPVETDFPWPAIAQRQPFTMTHEGITLASNLIYLPASGRGPWPLLIIAYPSPAIRWEKATIQFSAAGYAVVAVTPDEGRGLDLEAHSRDLLLALSYARQGQLSPHIQGDDLVLLSGSFGSLYAYRALPAMTGVRAIVNIGGVSDGFLGIQALYSEDLQIPPPYDLALAALGRPDRDPGFFLAYSPAFWAKYHPPTLLIHTYEDEVIPYNQSVRLAEALDLAGVAHDLYLYHSQTHYLDPRTPTDQAVDVFERTLDFVRTYLPPGS